MAMAMLVTMALLMTSSERKPVSITQSQDEAHTTIGDFTESTVSKSGNDLHLVRVMSERLDNRMPDISEVEIWGTVSLWMFLLSLLFLFSLRHYFFRSRAQYKWRRLRFLPPPEVSQMGEEFPCAPDPPKGCPQWY
jgi:hypothetical protein